MDKKRLARTTVVAAALLLAVGGGVAPAGAVSGAATVVTAGADGTAAPGMLAALQRDLGVSAPEALALLRAESRAAGQVRTLRAGLGPAYGGAWLDTTGRLTVAVTDPAKRDAVRAGGARTVLVSRTEAQLDAAVAALDRAAGRWSRERLIGWHVDPQANRVVLRVRPDGLADAGAFLAASGADPATVRIEAGTETPRPHLDLRGGGTFLVNGFRCMSGFSVVGGFVTAGHCGPVGAQVTTLAGAPVGTVRGSAFPGRDYAWVEVNSSWTPRPWITGPNGANLTVTGATDPPVGTVVCRPSPRLGWQCGRITARNATINYPQGTVSGLLRASVCSVAGESGAPWVAGQRAVGITSGGSGSCGAGGTSFIQPVGPILAAFRLTLVTG